MKKIRRKDDKRVNIDLGASILNKLRKLARIEDTKVKPYIEDQLAQHVYNKQEEGII